MCVHMDEQELIRQCFDRLERLDFKLLRTRTRIASAQAQLAVAINKNEADDSRAVLDRLYKRHERYLILRTEALRRLIIMD